MNGDLKESGPFSLTYRHIQYAYIRMLVEHEREQNVQVVVLSLKL